MLSISPHQTVNGEARDFDNPSSRDLSSSEDHMTRYIKRTSPPAAGPRKSFVPEIHSQGVVVDFGAVLEISSSGAPEHDLVIGSGVWSDAFVVVDVGKVVDKVGVELLEAGLEGVLLLLLIAQLDLPEEGRACLHHRVLGELVPGGKGAMRDDPGQPGAELCAREERLVLEDALLRRDFSCRHKRIREEFVERAVAVQHIVCVQIEPAMAVHYFVACDVRNHRHLAVGTLLVIFQQGLYQVIAFGEVLTGEVLVPPQKVLIVRIGFAGPLHKVILKVGHIPLHPDLVDLARDELRHALPRGQPHLLPPVVQHHQLLHLGIVPQAKFYGVAEIVLPKLRKVLETGEVGNLKAVSIDGDVWEDLLARNSHELFEPPHLVNNVAALARAELLAELKHGEQGELSVEVAPSAAVVEVEGGDEAVRLHREGPHQVADVTDHCLVGPVHRSRHVSPNATRRRNHLLHSFQVYKCREGADVYKVIRQGLEVSFRGEGFIKVQQNHNAGGVTVFGGRPLQIEALVGGGVDEDGLFACLFQDGGEVFYEGDEVPVGEGLLGKVGELILDLLPVAGHRHWRE